MHSVSAVIPVKIPPDFVAQLVNTLIMPPTVRAARFIACHMPRIEQTIKDNYVAAHTFRFITPQQTEQSGIPNPCTSCHTGKSNQWAKQELAKWNNASPWRVAQ